MVCVTSVKNSSHMYMKFFTERKSKYSFTLMNFYFSLSEGKEEKFSYFHMIARSRVCLCVRREFSSSQNESASLKRNFLLFIYFCEKEKEFFVDAENNLCKYF